MLGLPNHKLEALFSAHLPLLELKVDTAHLNARGLDFLLKNKQNFPQSFSLTLQPAAALALVKSPSLATQLGAISQSPMLMHYDPLTIHGPTNLSVMRYFVDGMCFTNQSIQLGLHSFSLALTGTALMDHQGHIFRQIVESVPHVSTLKLPHLYTKISDLASQRHLTAITVCIMANETGDIQQFKQCIDRTCALQNLTLTVR